MEHLRSMLLEEIDSFRELGHKFENKEISSADFKATSGGMGVYAHRGGEEFMIRLRIPSGILNTQELKVIYNLDFWGNGSICTSWWRRVYDKT